MREYNLKYLVSKFEILSESNYDCLNQIIIMKLVRLYFYGNINVFDVVSHND